MLKEHGVKALTNSTEIIDHSLYRKYLLRRWRDIDTLIPEQYKQIDSTALKMEAKSAPSNRNIREVRIPAKQLPTGQVMEIIGPWPNTHFTRDYGHTPKTVEHIFQCNHKDPLWQRLGKL